MKLYMVRHGETDWNIEKRLQGRTDIPLNQNGVRLAQAAARALKDVPFDLAFSSPLKRAMETAKIIWGNRMAADIIADDRLMEISFGVYEGLKSSKEHYEIPDPQFSAFFHDPQHYHPPAGGESIEQLMQRTKNFLMENTVKAHWEAKTILIVTHGAAVRALIAAAMGIPVGRLWGERVPPNCSVTIVEYRQGIFRMLQENKVYQ